MIYKYKMQANSTFEIEMPMEMDPLSVDREPDGYAYLYARVNPEMPILKRRFALVRTGDAPPQGMHHIGTVVYSQNDVRHYFCEPAVPPRI